MVKQGVSTATALVAGYVDAIGFVSLGGVFVSFMSGNSTRMGVGLGMGLDVKGGLAALLILSFVGGVVAWTWLRRAAGPKRALFGTLAVAAALAGAGGALSAGWTVAGGVLMAGAMGGANTVFQQAGQSGQGLTYMTGTLVRIGHSLAEGRWAAFRRDVLLWSGMVVGAVAGAAVYRLWGVAALWVPVAVLCALAPVAHSTSP